MAAEYVWRIGETAPWLAVDSQAGAARATPYHWSDAADGGPNGGLERNQPSLS